MTNFIQVRIKDDVSVRYTVVSDICYIEDITAELIVNGKKHVVPKFFVGMDFDHTSRHHILRLLTKCGYKLRDNQFGHGRFFKQMIVVKGK